MRDGHIVEQGSHEALLEKGGFYAELYESQFTGVERPASLIPNPQSLIPNP